ncbi:unnamed protein product [Parajaminaea phylloscopi]
MSPFPPRLVIRKVKPNIRPDPPVLCSDAHLRPNLMPFSIEYTGPANVDGYLFTSGNGFEIDSAGHSGGRKSSTAVMGSPQGHKPAQNHGKPEYSHFRGRRLYNTVLDLPEGYVGLVCSLDKNVAPKTLLQGASPENGGTLGAGAGSSAAGPNEVASGSGVSTQERVRLLERKQKRKEAAAGAPKRAAMAAFSMDDDDSEDDAGPVGDEDEDAYPSAGETPEPGSGGFNGDYSVGTPEMAGGTPVAAGQSSSDAHQQGPVNALRPVSRGDQTAQFHALNVWNPDGPLDQGDDDFVKTFREYVSLSAVLHSTEL